MILSKTAIVKIAPPNFKHFKELGYDVSCNDLIEVPIEHLQKRSNIKIEAKCDICGIEKEKSIKAYNNSLDSFNFYACTKCNREKHKLGYLEKYGLNAYTATEEYKEQRSKICQERYGVDHYSQTDEYKEKYKQTSLERYGYPHPLQHPDIREKQWDSAGKFKDYILPSGEVARVQGYEDKALDLLLKTYKEYDLILGIKNIQNEIGEIWYTNKNDEKEHRYFPDIYIKSENRIIEVKSSYTYKVDLENNKLKEKACLDKGLNFEFLIL